MNQERKIGKEKRIPVIRRKKLSEAYEKPRIGKLHSTKAFETLHDEHRICDQQGGE